MAPVAEEKDEKYSDKETQARFEAALRGGLKTPHKPLKEKTKAKKRETSEPAPRSRSGQKINK